MKRRVVVLAPILLLLAGLGTWRFWLLALPRPSLEALIPTGYSWRIQVHRLAEFQSGLGNLKRDGAGAGSARAWASLLASGRGGKAVRFFLNQAGRDEALAAAYPGGGLLFVSRAGLREALVLSLASGLGLARRRSGSSLLRFKPGSGDQAWYLVRRGGILILSRDELLIKDCLKLMDNSPEAPEPALGCGLLLDWKGEFGALKAQATMAAGGPGRPARLEAQIRVMPVEGPQSWAKLGELSGPGLWFRFPAKSLAALDLASASPLLSLLGLDPRPDPSLPQKARAFRALNESETGLALTGLDRRGPLPLPQLSCLLRGQAGLLDKAFLSWLDGEMRKLSQGHFGLEDRSFGGFPVYGIRLPVTELLGPTLSAQGGDLVLASSFAAATSVLASGPGAFDPGPSDLYRGPALGYLFLDLPGLAYQLRGLGESMRSSGLLNPAAEEGWLSKVSPGLELLEAAAPLRAALEVQGSEFLLRLECGESASGTSD